MMSLREINNNLEKYKNNEEIIHQTARQIIKDFGLFGLEVTFSGDIPTAYDELHSQLCAHLEYLTTNNSEKLFALLYHIDVSESFFKKTDLPQEATSANEYLGHLIIKRELTKVVIRNYFKYNT
jgi:hypothetical protein